MADWQPLSVREGRADPFELEDGVPKHMIEALLAWVEGTLWPDRRQGAGEVLAPQVCLVLHITGRPSDHRIDWIKNACRADEQVFLDVLDVSLKLTNGRQSRPLQNILSLGDSLWTLQPDRSGIVRRVSEGESAAYAEATSPRDPITDELSEAWSKTYGRNSDSSDAWDHAIKAIQLALLPIVAPNKVKGTMADVIGQLGGQPRRFDFRLETSSTTTGNVEALVQMLRLVWPNPDRHGAPTRRKPSDEEAQNIAHLAVLLVNWARSGALTRA